ncbi:unnamed protein product [Cuscuta campestris]|uniref:CCHC-type domain-containing protein n=1 Tax=Cuscuta campestris TaxID=132261 RepID=A0A484LRC7_9ASTE|nr:unnamed protein product [Cuscuta campestris]
MRMGTDPLILYVVYGEKWTTYHEGDYVYSGSADQESGRDHEGIVFQENIGRCDQNSQFVESNATPVKSPSTAQVDEEDYMGDDNDDYKEDECFIRRHDPSFDTSFGNEVDATLDGGFEDGSDLAIGLEFSDKRELKKKMADVSIQGHFETKTVKSDKKRHVERKYFSRLIRRKVVSFEGFVERMRIYIRSTNFQLWLFIKNGEETPMKKVSEKLVPKTEDEFDAEDIKKIENYAKAINMLYCAVNPDDYRKISCCATTKEMWDKLEVTSHALKAAKKTVEEVSSDDDNEFRLVIKKFHKFMMKEFECKGRKHDSPPKCYGCGEVGHIKTRCPKCKNGKDKPGFKKQRAYISWGGDSSDESTDQEEDEAANLCLMAHEDHADEAQEEEDATKVSSFATDIAIQDLEKERAQTASSLSATSPPSVEVVPDLAPQVDTTIVQNTPQVLDKMPEPDKAAAKPVTFADLFKGNRDPDQGMVLKHYDVGEGVLHIPDSVIKPIEELWGFCLVGCFTGRFPGLKTVDAIVKSWNLPVWVQLHNVPMQLWSEEGIGMLASKVGKPLRTDLVTKQHGKGGFCRVLVEVDFSKQPVTQFEVFCMGKSYTQTVEFEEDPKYCYHCKTWNHGPLHCRALEMKGKQDLAELEAKQTEAMAKPKEHNGPPGNAVSREWVPIGKIHTEPKGGLIPSSSNPKEKAKDPCPNTGPLVDDRLVGKGTDFQKKKSRDDGRAYYMTDMQSFICLNCPEDTPSSGNFITWNKGNKLAKLDRVLINHSWADIGLTPSCEFMDFNFLSNHCPILFQYGSSLGNKGKPFKLFNRWLQHEDFPGLVCQSWEAGVTGSKQYSLCSKLKRLKPPLKFLNRRAFGHISRRAMEAKEDYRLVIKEVVLDPNNQTLLDEAEAKRKRANFLMDAELAFYQQKAKCDFIMNSDRCTSYFHSIVKKNRKKNVVGFLVREDGSKITSIGEVANIFVDYYTTLFGTSSPVEPVGPDILAAGSSVPISAHSALLATVTPEEVRQVVFDIGSDKAPGPEGYTAAFFKNQWVVVAQGVFPLVMECVSSASSSIMVNGDSHGFFPSERGLRQGDPMAPTLFLFCIEYFSRLLNKKAKEGLFNFHKDCASLGITHLTFANDLMLFSRGDLQSVQVFMDALDHFSRVSGLILNPTKSNIFLAGKYRDSSHDLLALASFPRGNLIPGKVYELFRANANHKPWMAFIWQSFIPRKCSFTMWLALRRRLPTKTNLDFLGLPMDCTFCGNKLDDVDHLFFSCKVSKDVWRAVNIWLQMEGQLSTLNRAIRYLKAFRRGDVILKKARRIALACRVFHLWKLRNAVHFDQEPLRVDAVVFKIKLLKKLDLRWNNKASTSAVAIDEAARYSASAEHSRVYVKLVTRTAIAWSLSHVGLDLTESRSNGWTTQRQLVGVINDKSDDFTHSSSQELDLYDLIGTLFLTKVVCL